MTTPDARGLAERLRKIAAWAEVKISEAAADSIDEAAAALEALSDENERLREALAHYECRDCGVDLTHGAGNGFIAECGRRVVNVQRLGCEGRKANALRNGEAG